MADLTIREMIQYLLQGGVAIIVFIIWYFTFTRSIRQTEAFLKQSLSQSGEAFEKHAELNKQLLQYLRDEQDYKTTLTGILDRISIKLDTPAQCPILMTGKKFTLEVQE